MGAWKDVTLYRAGERGNVKPRVWSIKSGVTSVVVYQLQGGDEWYSRCAALTQGVRLLDATSLEAARLEAVKATHARLSALAADAAELLRLTEEES